MRLSRMASCCERTARVAKGRVTGGSDRDLRRGVYRTGLMALSLPPFVGGTLTGIADYCPLPRFQQIFFGYPALYVLGVSAGVLCLCGPATEYIIALPRLPKEEAIRGIRRGIGPFSWYLAAFVCVYSLFGVPSANFSLVRLGVRRGYTPARYACGVSVAAPLVVLTRRWVPEQASTLPGP